MKIALLIQYDGSAYHGWQIQKDPETIQGHIERALCKVFDEEIGLIGSGRTDSGVHALGQVAHFEVEACSIPIKNLWKALNRQLPHDIRLMASSKVSDDFHSRFAAVQRQYLYQITTAPNVLERNTQWYIRHALDISKLYNLSELILGEHDFSSFCYAGTETENMVCNLALASWDVHPSGVMKFTIAGDRFLHHMVRMLVGSMIEVARGKWDIEHFSTLLNKPNRKSHTVTAPANGLALMQVSYPEDIQPSWYVAKDALV
ncbi:MAG: tRNA pseudouridine(38-40) synthase TruA [FCB group bacterium]|nr:tRNA pseudouridine(38-40) synthase TruA [FCB group bacterium]MBL7027886.1 tRNA pseudouridine(38-40) synthase TruA [Candidatus Neomarinimicrobiota bacterium]MBL7121895.1 tRNA pseudouridine(38-40) synthase TruA [Candidatus Neomarinimicrobiota bacterium]